jgi:hypothetical protein
MADASSATLIQDGMEFSAFCSPGSVVPSPLLPSALVNRPLIDWQPQHRAITPVSDQATTRAGERPLPTSTPTATAPPAITTYTIELMTAEMPVSCPIGMPWNTCEVIASP